MKYHETDSTGRCLVCGSQSSSNPYCDGPPPNPKLITLVPKTQQRAAEGKDAALELLAQLRVLVEAGDVSAITGIIVYDDDDTRMYVASVKPTTRLRILGALNYALHRFLKDEGELGVLK